MAPMRWAKATMIPNTKLQFASYTPRGYMPEQLSGGSRHSLYGGAAYWRMAPWSKGGEWLGSDTSGRSPPRFGMSSPHVAPAHDKDAVAGDVAGVVGG